MKNRSQAFVYTVLIIMLSLLLCPQTLSAQPADEPVVEILSVRQDLNVLIYGQSFPEFLELQVTMKSLDSLDQKVIEIATFDTQESDSFLQVFYIPPTLVGDAQIELRLEGINNDLVVVHPFINQTFVNFEASSFSWGIIDPEQDSSEEYFDEKPKVNLISEPTRLTTASIEIEATKWLVTGDEDIKPEDPVPFVWPAEQRWLSGFDFSVTHPGIDIAAIKGDLIFAAASGKIVAVNRSNRGYGNMVMIDHQNGYHTLYAHLNIILVERGSYVFQGQPIGLAGSTGNSSGVHLHFEIHHQGKFINPWLFFNR